MAEATWYSQGTFCWAELATTDVAGARDFYSTTFGMTSDESPLPEGGTYVTFRKGDKAVAGLAAQQEEERKQGIPPHWNSYIAADDADAVTKEAESLGATVVAPPFDVMDLGRMSVLLDPTGAAISLWQGKSHIGAEVYAEEGSIGWYELMTQDPTKAVEFYTELFGYGQEDFPSTSGPYVVLKHKGENAAGIMGASQPDIPPVWTPYFQVADAEATYKKAIEGGASEMLPVTEGQGVGHFAWVKDPQGAVIAFIQPAPRP